MIKNTKEITLENLPTISLKDHLVMMRFSTLRMEARSKTSKKNSYLLDYTLKDLRIALYSNPATWSPKLKADIAKLRREAEKELTEMRKEKEIALASWNSPFPKKP